MMFQNNALNVLLKPLEIESIIEEIKFSVELNEHYINKFKKIYDYDTVELLESKNEILNALLKNQKNELLKICN